MKYSCTLSSFLIASQQSVAAFLNSDGYISTSRFAMHYVHPSPRLVPAPSLGKAKLNHRNLEGHKRKMSGNDGRDGAEILPLSASDIARLQEARSRQETIPIMILDAMLPGQRLHFGSADPKFRKLVDYVLDDVCGEIGMIGLNPHTGRPLNMGVTLSVTDECIEQFDPNGMLTISAQGHRRFEVQGEPWMDDSKSFYLADVEITENRMETMTEEQGREAKYLAGEIPGLVDNWMSWILETGKSDEAGMKSRMDDIGPMPDAIGPRAIWVAALINPIPALGVCLEVRPAMLACKNDFDRMNLASAAIQSSIDHLSGKRRLF